MTNWRRAWMILLLSGAVTAQAHAQERIKAFGHDIEIVRPEADEAKLQVDGKELHHNWQLSIDEILSVGGVGVVVGVSGPGGNACAGASFVVSLPEGRDPRFDGPLDTCQVAEHEVRGESLVFRTRAFPGTDGEEWIWTLAEGFRSTGKIAFKPDPSRGWAELAARTIEHPAELLGYGPLAAQIDRLVGAAKPQFDAIVNGPGSGEFKGDMYVGSVCMAHNCPPQAC